MIKYLITPRFANQVAHAQSDDRCFDRYNSSNADAIRTWLTLGAGVYNDTTAGFPPKYLLRGPIVQRPSLSVTSLPYWYSYDRWVFLLLLQRNRKYVCVVFVYDVFETTCHFSVLSKRGTVT